MVSMKQRAPVWQVTGRKLALSVLVSSGILAGQSALAQAITPNNVFQQAEVAAAQAKLLAYANYSTSDYDLSSFKVAPRKPRHVYQKAFQILQKIQKLRFLNGLPETELPTLVEQEPTPGDVKVLVDRINGDLAELREPFGITEQVSEQALPTDKTPTDVYQMLMRLDAIISGMDLPETVPNEIFVVAQAISKELEKILIAKGGKPGDIMHRRAYDRQIKHLYPMGQKLLEALKKANPEVVLPVDSKGDDVTADDVLDLMGNVQAETLALMRKYNVPSKSEDIPPVSGMDPSEVHSEIDYAIQLVEELAAIAK